MKCRLIIAGAFLALMLGGCGSGGGSQSLAPAPGAIYFVNVATGDDAYAGSSSNPFKTITRGVSLLAPGDTLCIIGGDYRGEGEILIGIGASAGSPVVVQNCAGKVQIDSLRIDSSAWVEVRGLTITSNKTLPAGWPDMPAVLIDDANPLYTIDPAEAWATRATKVAARYSSYATFVDPLGGTGSWEYALYSVGINVVASQHISLIGNTISHHTVGINLRNSSSNILVEDNAISYCLDGVRGDKRLIDSFSFSTSTLRGNHLWQTFREGIRLTFGAKDNLVENNRIEFTGHSHIATWQAGGGNTIRHNVLREGGYYAETMQWPGPSAISVHSAGPNTLVDGNSIALQVDATLRDGNGIIIDNNNGDAATLANNLIYRVMGSGISTVLSGNATIVHNTIVESGNGTTAATNGMGMRFYEASDINNTIANNLIVNPANGGIWFRASTLAAQTFIDNNLYDFTGLPLVADGAATYADLFAWQATGRGLQAVAAPALLQDPLTGLFGLQAMSPAGAAGTTAHSIGHDREQNTRANPPAIGAYKAAATHYAEPKKFLFGLHSDTTATQDFVAVTDDIALVARLRAQLALPQASRSQFINGPIRRGGLGDNLGWDWHFVTGQWDMVDVATELCDGSPNMVQDDLDYWVDTVNRYCPWSAYVKAEM